MEHGFFCLLTQDFTFMDVILLPENLPILVCVPA